MLEKFCDILVIGTELTGLLSSALLAKRGLSVLVLPPIGKASGGHSVEPHCFFPLNSVQLKSILGRLGISEEELPKKASSQVSLQVILPGHRIDLSTHAATFDQELTREFPEEKAQILDLYKKLESYREGIDQEKLEELFLPQGFWDRYKLKRLVKEYHLDQKVGDFFQSLEKKEGPLAFFESQLRHVSEAFTSDPFLYQMAKFVSLSLQGACHVDGGIESLKALLLQRIAEYGGEILDPRQIESLAFERATLSHLVAGGLESHIHPKYAIWNRPFSDLIPYLPDRFRFRRFTRGLAAFTPTHYRFCAQYTLPEKCWPVGMQTQVLCIQDPHGPLEGENCFYLERESAAANSPQSGLYTLSVHYMLPVQEHDSPEDSFKARHERIRHFLLSLMPFTDDQLQLSFPRKRDTDDGFQATLFPLDKGPFELFLDAAKLHPVYQQKTERFIDLFTSNFKSPSPNLFLSSPEILNHFGLDGKVILAKTLSQVLRDNLQQEHAKALRKKKRVV